MLRERAWTPDLDADLGLLLVESFACLEDERHYVQSAFFTS